MYRPSSSHRSSQQDAMRPPPKMPDRPLVPYMRFSKKMWPKVRADKPDVPLWELGKIIGQLWNSITPAEKAAYNQEYEQDKIEYEKAMKQYNAAYAQYMVGKSRVKSVHQQQQQQDKGSGGRKTMAIGAPTDSAGITSGVFMQPIDEEDPFELAGKRLAAIRYDRNNRLMAELFSPSYLPDPRAFVPQQRIDHFRRQRMSLEQHQVKSNEELARLAELFSQRKRAIQRDSEAHQDAMKRVCSERPRVDQQRCEELTEQYKEQLLNAWEQFQTKQAAIQAKLEADRRANPVLAELITRKSPAQEEDEQQQQHEEDSTDQQHHHHHQQQQQQQEQLLLDKGGGEEGQLEETVPKIEEENPTEEAAKMDEEKKGEGTKEKEDNEEEKKEEENVEQIQQGEEKKEEGKNDGTEAANGGGGGQDQQN